MRFNPMLEGVGPPPLVELAGWLRAGEPLDPPLIDLSQAAPEGPPAPELAAHLAERARDPESARYTPVEGIAELREALAAHHGRRYGAVIPSEDVVVTAGANQAFWPAVMAVAGPGDEVIVPLPHYFNHVMTLEMLGVRPVLLPFDEEAAGVPDPEAVEAAVTDRTRALVLITPNNPTGSVYPPDVLDRLADLASRRGFALIVDETYVDLLPEDHPPHRLFQRQDREEVLIHLYSFSKSLAIPGYRVGALVAGERVRREVMKVQDCVLICAPHLSQLAALYGLEHLQGWVASQRHRIGERRQAFTRALEGRATGFRTVASGAYFAYLRHPFEGEHASAVARRLLDEQHLLVVPGTVFGPGQEAYLRLAVANVAEAELEEVADRLARAG